MYDGYAESLLAIKFFLVSFSFFLKKYIFKFGKLAVVSDIGQRATAISIKRQATH